MISKRCNFNMTECEHFDTFNIPDICKVFDLKNQFWSEFMKYMEPKIKCPIKKRAYKFVNAPVDLGYVAHFPLDGYTWSFTQKVFRSIRGRKKKQLIFCVTFEVTITKTRSGRKKN